MKNKELYQISFDIWGEAHNLKNFIKKCVKHNMSNFVQDTAYTTQMAELRSYKKLFTTKSI